MENWKTKLEELLPLLGHRNWVVVTDMAYPLQSKPGILTLYAPEPFKDAVATVAGLIAKAPHVFAHVRLDAEQLKMSGDLCPEWPEYQQAIASLPDMKAAEYVAHAQLIERLDEVSRLYQVVIVKTPLTLPYSSVFFELDCRYWDADRERKIRA